MFVGPFAQSVLRWWSLTHRFVAELHANNNSIGEFPESILGLSKLNFLSLSCNDLGAVHEEFGAPLIFFLS